VSTTLTPEEIGEIAEYARQHPELARLLTGTTRDPRVVLELIREEKKKENK
jgi:hypothetical protein